MNARRRPRFWPIVLVATPAAISSAILLGAWSPASAAPLTVARPHQIFACTPTTQTVNFTQTNIHTVTPAPVVRTQVQTQTQTATATTTAPGVNVPVFTTVTATVTASAPPPVTVTDTVTTTETTTTTAAAAPPPAGLLARPIQRAPQAVNPAQAVRQPREDCGTVFVTNTFTDNLTQTASVTSTNRITNTANVTNNVTDTNSVDVTNTHTALVEKKTSFSHDARIAVGVGGVAVSGVAGFIFLRLRRRGDYTL